MLTRFIESLVDDLFATDEPERLIMSMLRGRDMPDYVVDQGFAHSADPTELAGPPPRSQSRGQQGNSDGATGALAVQTVVVGVRVPPIQAAINRRF